VAEQFGTLESLFPGRIDLGLGRAPGTDQRTAHALRRTLGSNPDAFPNDVLELLSYFQPVDGQAVRAVPGTGLTVPLYILGSSLFGAQVAAALGLPFAFASHFAAAQMIPAVELYRARFKASPCPHRAVRPAQACGPGRRSSFRRRAASGKSRSRRWTRAGSKSCRRSR
jgi:luciferase family oxidoreductase group 1